ncbi:MAG: carbonic anhydrase [Candidatus Nitrosoabyssus spongiisocia]|nr:MAG: carbonic anhydrase [Nitrosopumilaceae archaeon AB1(1)]
MDGIFATSINCIDGRIQNAVSDWIKKEFSVNYVDTITEPGVDKRISDSNIASSLKQKVLISTKVHNSKFIVISGHYDCAANPVSQKEHTDCILHGMKIINSWNFDAKVVGLWIDEKFQIVPITDL